MPSIRFSAWRLLYGAVVLVALFLIYGQDRSPGLVLVALVIPLVIFRSGIAMLTALAQPVAEPPPAGELRKVKIQFRCEICGTEVRMTSANDEMPEPPRHCLEDMSLMTPAFD